MRGPEEDVAAFWAKVDRRGVDECWPWLAALNRKTGHGRCRLGGQPMRAHQAVWQITRGSRLAAGLVVRHLCNNPPCCNPAHLASGTPAENNADRMAHNGYARHVREPWRAARRWAMGPAPRPLRERLLRGFDVIGECWIWRGGSVGRRDRRAIKVAGKSVAVHRASYETFVGPIPPGAMILHSCDNSACMNPAHLRPGTHQQNMDDMRTRGRAAKGTRNHFGRTKFAGEANGRSKLTEEAARAIHAGAPTRDIIARWGVSRGTVSHVRVGRTWAHVGPSRPRDGGQAMGERSPNARLTERAVRKIRAGARTRDIMAEYGVSRQAVSRVRRGLAWRHVE
jgi:uncharacterized protein YerC